MLYEPVDHPRSRGVYGIAVSAALTAAGSSPLARGLQAHVGSVEVGGGIIPARAGFTPDNFVGKYTRQDHPRSRGVYFHAVSQMILSRGSSPLARGLRTGAEPRCRPARIIPARAGFTALGKTGPFDWADHPRSRGVYPCSKSTSGFPDWIIPARAGFTSPDSPAPSLSQDHPRSRGVYSSCAHAPSPFFGSSPLARGLLLEKGVEDRRGRIIPARAGFTGARSRPARVGRDHPRSRGVYVATKAALNH